MHVLEEQQILFIRSLVSHQIFIPSVNLMKNKESGDSRGFGFITFDTAEDANDAIQGMNGKVRSKGRRQRVKQAIPSGIFHMLIFTTELMT